MTTSEPLTYQLGEHTLTVEEEQCITIANETEAVHLEHEETYRLLLVLQDAFHQ